jgi:hypothetical protein
MVRDWGLEMGVHHTLFYTDLCEAGIPYLMIPLANPATHLKKMVCFLGGKSKVRVLSSWGNKKCRKKNYATSYTIPSKIGR